MYRHLIWDFDGTLFDSYPHIAAAMQAVLLRRGVLVTAEDAYHWTKRSIGQAVDHYAQTYGVDRDELLGAYHDLGASLPDDSIRPFPFAREVLERVAGDGRGMNFIVTHRGDSTWKYVERSGFTPLFREVVTAKNGFAPKPSGEANRYLVGKYGLNPREVLAVGDREIDILAGVDAGVDACLCIGPREVQRPPATRAGHLVTSLDQLLPLLAMAME